MSHEKRIIKLEQTVGNHEARITKIEKNYTTIISGIDNISQKIPSHPVLNILQYMGAGAGVLIIIILCVAAVYG